MYFPRQVFEPIPANMSQSAIEEFAESVAKRLKFRQDDAPVTFGGVDTAVVALISRLGGRIVKGVTVAPKQTDHDDSLIVFGPDDFAVHPRPNPLLWGSIEAGQAIANAAEIGHLFLHYPMVRTAQKAGEDTTVVMAAPRHSDDDVQKRCDAEAYWFASALIFPKALFRALWKHHSGNARRLAYEQGVLVSNVEFRAKRLGLLQAEAA